MGVIDLRSDTVTLPAKEMRKAMQHADLGDDVLGEDPEVNRLEKTAAEILGKEAALLVPSGTFGNQLSLFTHAERGNEVILSETSHIVEHEAGAASILASVQLRTVCPKESWLSLGEVDSRIRKVSDIHFPKTGCIALENALSNGDVQPLSAMGRIHDKALEHRIPVHLDGARIFNAALALACGPEEIAAQAESVMFCLSKGLAAPVGSVVAGGSEFIARARKLRKIMGGGMRQAGIIAAPGLIALTKMRDRLVEDHETARTLAGILAGCDELEVDLDRVKINMVFCTVRAADETSAVRDWDRAASFVRLLGGHGILTYPPENGVIRFVTHYGITGRDIRYIEKILPKVMEEL
jgi:threonine aldolase